jgi:hypothetical protein
MWTCSILGRENEESAAAFAADHPRIAAVRTGRRTRRRPLTAEGQARLAELAGAGHTLQLTAAPDPDGRLLHRPVQTDGMTAQTSTAHERVLIIDFGSQVTQLIARRVRESGVYCEIVPYDRAEAILDDFSPQAVILSGGPSSVAEAKARASEPRCSSWACRCWASATASS